MHSIHYSNPKKFFSAIDIQGQAENQGWKKSVRKNIPWGEEVWD